LRTEVGVDADWKSADITCQRIANPVQSGASVPATFVPGPRAPKTERVP